VDQLFLKAEDVARRLGLSRSTVYALIAAGQLPSVRFGRAVRVPADGLQRWAEGRAREAATGGDDGRPE
jgi:excisionase family DNA binding protein